MRLTCPNCDAQYEVPDDVIPQDGRDVQCSNCGNTWFQAHPDHAVEVVDDPEAPEPDAEWTPEVTEDEPLQEVVADSSDDIDETESSGPVTMSSDAPDEVLAAAVKAAIRRAKPTQDVEDPDDEPQEEASSVAAEHEEHSFEDDLDASLNELEDVADETEESEEDAEDSVYFDASEDEDESTEEVTSEEPKRRTIDPTVANILQEEAALEAERRAEDSSLESQPDLGLEESQDDAAKRARQARERMARMRGLPADSIDKPVEPIPANSRRDLLPDIEEINSTLRATEDRAPDEQPDGRPTANQRRAGGNRIGFAMALLLIGLFAYVYNRPEVVSATIPASENVVAGFVNSVDNARIWLDSQMTKLMLWLDSLSSE